MDAKKGILLVITYDDHPIPPAAVKALGDLIAGLRVPERAYTIYSRAGAMEEISETMKVFGPFFNDPMTNDSPEIVSQVNETSPEQTKL